MMMSSSMMKPILMMVTALVIPMVISMSLFSGNMDANKYIAMFYRENKKSSVSIARVVHFPDFLFLAELSGGNGEK